MANEGFGVLSTILNGLFAGGATQTGSAFSTKGARFAFLYNTYVKATDNITAYSVQLSDDGGTTWFIVPSIQRNTTGTPTAAPTASETWRDVVDLGPVAGSIPRQIRIVATAAGTAGSTLVTKVRFDHAPGPVLVS